MQRHYRFSAISLGLVVLTVTAFAPILKCQFVNWDDNGYVVENSYVTGGLNAEDVCWAFTATEMSNWHPLTWLSLQLDASLYGLNPAGYHVTNLVLHVAAVVLLFWFLAGATGAIWRSAAVAAFFAVHPLRVESVAWVAERKDVLSGLFWMLTLGAYLLYVRRPGLLRYLLVVLALALGLMAKPMLVTLPCVLCLLDYWPFARLPWQWAASGSPAAAQGVPAIPRVSLRHWIWEKVPLVLLAIVGIALTLAAQTFAMQNLGDLPLPVRVANAVWAYATYLLQVFWPVNLCAFYPLPNTVISWWQTVAAGLFLLAISVLVLRAARRRPYLAVGWLWYLGTLVPVIGLVQVGQQAHADRYTYLPLIGFFLMLAWGVPSLVARWRFGEVFLAVLTPALLAGCVAGTILQVRYWQDSHALWQRAVAVNPNSALARRGLAIQEAQEGRLDDAIADTREAIRLEPQSPILRGALISFLRKARRDVEADEENRRLMELGLEAKPAP